MEIIISLIIFFMGIIIISNLKYRDFKILDITFSKKEDLDLGKKLANLEIKKQLFYIVLSIVLIYGLKKHSEIELISLVAMVVYIFVSYLSLIKTRDKLYKIVESRIPFEKIKIDTRVTREMGNYAPNVLWIWGIWSMTLIPLLIELVKNEKNMLIFDFIISVILLILPLSYKAFSTKKTSIYTDNYENDIKYRAEIEKNNGKSFILSSFLVVVFILFLRMYITKINDFKLLIIWIVALLFSLLILDFYFSRKNKKISENLVGEIHINNTYKKIKWGMVYDESDSRIIVPKPIGYGTTINLANPIGKKIGIGMFIFLFFTFVFIISIFIIDFKITLNENYIKINAPLYNYEIKYSDINNISLSDEKLEGIRTNGVAMSNKAYGFFNIKNYGNVRYYSKNSLRYHVDIEEKDGDKILISLEDDYKTKKIFEDITKKIRQ